MIPSKDETGSRLTVEHICISQFNWYQYYLAYKIMSTFTTYTELAKICINIKMNEFIICIAFLKIFAYFEKSIVGSYMQLCN